MSFWNEISRNPHFEATLNHPFPAQVRADLLRANRNLDIGNGLVVGDAAVPMNMMVRPDALQAPGAPVPLAVPMAPTILSVAVPEGAAPGTVIQVQAPNGAMVQVAVPEGAAPGSVIQVQV